MLRAFDLDTGSIPNQMSGSIDWSARPAGWGGQYTPFGAAASRTALNLPDFLVRLSGLDDGNDDDADVVPKYDSMGSALAATRPMQQGKGGGK